MFLCFKAIILTIKELSNDFSTSIGEFITSFISGLCGDDGFLGGLSSMCNNLVFAVCVLIFFQVYQKIVHKK